MIKHRIIPVSLVFLCLNVASAFVPPSRSAFLPVVNRKPLTPRRPSRLPPLNLGAAEEALAGVCFPLSLPPYLAFLYFASYEKNGMPKLTLAGFKFLLVFVAGSIPAAILATSSYGVSLADSDWLHGTAEGLLTITNLLIVLGLRGENSPNNPQPVARNGGSVLGTTGSGGSEGAYKFSRSSAVAAAAVSLALLLLVGQEAFAASSQGTAAAPGNDHLLFGLSVHAPFLGGVGDLPASWVDGASWFVAGGGNTLQTSGLASGLGGGGWAHPEPANALSVPTWVIHASSLVEWLVAMGLMWKRADDTGNQTWKGVTWGMLPLHTSGICACTYHLFYNAESVGFLVALQAFLTVVGNCTLCFATLRLAKSNGWEGSTMLPAWASSAATSDALPFELRTALAEVLVLDPESPGGGSAAAAAADAGASGSFKIMSSDTLSPPRPGNSPEQQQQQFTSSSSSSRQQMGAGSAGGGARLSGFEDLAESLRTDEDPTFLLKLLGISLFASYAVKYGELFVDFPFADGDTGAVSETSSSPTAAVALAFIFIPTVLNMAKWWARSKDPENNDTSFDMF